MYYKLTGHNWDIGLQRVVSIFGWNDVWLGFI